MSLTEQQSLTLAALRRDPGQPVHFDQGFLTELRSDADTALVQLADRLGDEKLWVSKWSIGEVLVCQRSWLESTSGSSFSWSPATARGTICHKAVQLTLNWRGSPSPGELVDAALDVLADTDNSLGVWLSTLPPGQHAELRSLSVERVAAFLEAFPPLETSWRPVTEAKVSYPSSGPIVLSARPDLTIGAASDRESRKVIIDLKSGRHVPQHLDDLRYYALVETLVRGVPPRLLVSYSLESCRPVTEAVSENWLRTSLRRTFDAVDTMIALRIEGEEPTGCSRRWCRTCAPVAGNDEVVDPDERPTVDRADEE